MKLLKRICIYIKKITWLEWIVCAMIAANILFMIPTVNCRFWVDNLSSAGFARGQRGDLGGCYQVGFKHERKKNYTKAKYYFSEAERKARIICDEGKNKDACAYAEDSKKQLNRIIELEKNQK